NFFNLQPYNGVFTNHSKTRITDITDGTSNTILFGEGLGGVVNANGPWAGAYVGGHETGWAWVGGGAIGSKDGIGVPGAPFVTNQTGAGPVNWSSRHPGGSQFCFADGSVRFLKAGQTTLRSLTASNTGGYSTDWLVLQQLSGMRDGNNVQTNTLE